MATYATTDLHGRLDLYKKIKEILNPDDIVYFLGDAGDRGPKGWELIKAIYENPQFIYLKGNHEDMLVEAAKAYLRHPEYESEEYYLLKRNGGAKTLDDWWRDGEDKEWIRKLENLPLHDEYLNKDGKQILMSHAGYTPWIDPNRPGHALIPVAFELLWNRNHFYDEIDEDWLRNCVVVHGHTPILSLANKLCDRREDIPHGAYWYDGKRKCCLDNLSAVSDVACLLNLDTFEEILIEV